MASQHHHHHNSNNNNSQSSQSPRTTESMARSVGIPQRLRNEESWVEISSQPSSSSLSSIGDEIVTTGLRVQHNVDPRRRRRGPGMSHMALETRHAGTSSQEEYEESESESDHVLSSSNDSTHLHAARQEYDAGSSDEEDEDENATALGRRTDAGVAQEPVFTPQPNAFSHPPSVPGSYFPRSSQRSPSRATYPNRSASRTQHSSYNQADHDAALRASLSTLLSIGAAAARGLPKRNQATTAPGSNEPMSLRFVPESELMPTAANSSRPLSPSTRARSSPSISSQEAVALDMNKRKASASKPAGEKGQVKKKKKVQLVDDALISPTLLTWVVSAGVVVLVSVVGFGAGYVIGREVGRQEALSGLNGSAVLDSTSCGREVARGGSGSLRKFRWGSGVARSIVA
ncbi:hypothetical protein M430DRAFT_47810 [Amorphotheca resinae ATCC 22711]|uniref:REJ domain-containing protein n=1 Tax=Amorphotheca resinae ATCC 22711 TaxID=857342 RepID=A0A2T3BAI5_AMORE|nr:hypothetical protein M430DRAFT_47810 [Amorphotheca resinae ATCC 22711]PSS25335.1 hypothetical protein M430DRAFT_47810 [Amorphotheca resinae ATCC 22711]